VKVLNCPIKIKNNKMSPQEKAAELRRKLEKWKSHNEVHAKPADVVLYEFLSSFLSLLEVEERDFYERNTETVEFDQNEPEKESDPLANQSEESVDDKSQINATYDAADDADDTGGSAPSPDKGRG
jgi:hypothetical protein